MLCFASSCFNLAFLTDEFIIFPFFLSFFSSCIYDFDIGQSIAFRLSCSFLFGLIWFYNYSRVIGCWLVGCRLVLVRFAHYIKNKLD